MTASIVFTVDDDKVLLALAAVERGIDTLVRRVAEELARNAAQEAGKRSSRLGAPWSVDVSNPMVAHVEAPEWWAHFLAGGTTPHGPADAADRLVFEVDGETVWAQYVNGIAADHFDERAVAQTESRVDELMQQIIAEAT